MLNYCSILHFMLVEPRKSEIRIKYEYQRRLFINICAVIFYRVQRQPVYLALHTQVKGVTGKYFNNCNLSEPSSQASDV